MCFEDLVEPGSTSRHLRHTVGAVNPNSYTLSITMRVRGPHLGGGREVERAGAGPPAVGCRPAVFPRRRVVLRDSFGAGRGSGERLGLSMRRGVSREDGACDGQD